MNPFRGYRPTLLFWVIVFVIDSFTRLSFGTFVVEKVNASKPNVFSQHYIRLKSSTHAHYLGKLDEFERSEVDENDYNTAQVAETIEPTVLEGDFLIIAKFRYRLLGIFGGSERFAVLDRLDNETRERARVKVRKGDSLEGYVLSHIATESITMIGPAQETRDLRLFLPLEKKNANLGSI